MLAPFVRVGGVAEVAIGAGALVWGTRAWGALVALSYASFAAFVLFVRRRGGALGSCGCFGELDTPPTLAHVILTAVLACTGIGVAIGSRASLPAVVETQALLGLPALVMVAAGTFLAFLVVARLPQLLLLVHRQR